MEINSSLAKMEIDSSQSPERSLPPAMFPAFPVNDSNNNTEKTPYQSQFKEPIEIGRGGFGLVVKAKHKIDKMEYAVKIVFIEKWRERKKYLEEVEILAIFDHSNVVGYKQAWIEPYNGTDDIPQSSQSSQSGSQVTVDEAMVIDKASQEDEPFVLYIQMTLCHQNLREWMDDRKECSTKSEIEEIMIQILSGLRYIHGQKVIHHDIKPQNIFISVKSKISVQLGDFGLACKNRKDEHSREIGTLLYAAPEQLEKKCDPKSDVYSCGIVLFELLYPMKTDMERHDLCSKLKKEEFPPKFEILYPDWVRILKNTIHKNPNSRLTSSQLLDVINSEVLQNKIKLQELKIQRLEEEIILLKGKTPNSFNIGNEVFP